MVSASFFAPKSLAGDSVLVSLVLWMARLLFCQSGLSFCLTPSLPTPLVSLLICTGLSLFLFVLSPPPLPRLSFCCQNDQASVLLVAKLAVTPLRPVSTVLPGLSVSVSPVILTASLSPYSPLPSSTGTSVSMAVSCLSPPCCLSVSVMPANSPDRPDPTSSPPLTAKLDILHSKVSHCSSLPCLLLLSVPELR